MRWNGLDDEQNTSQFLAEKYQRDRETTSARVLPIETLAHAVGLSRPQFVCQHTMLPYRRAVASQAWEHPHGTDDDPAWRVNAVTQSDRIGAFLCADCIAEDVDFHGWAYWRRDHQLPGRYWCSKHNTTLRFATNKDAFLLSPTAAIKSTRPVDGQWVKRLRRNPNIERYLFVQSELLQRTSPLSSHGVTKLLQTACIDNGIHVGKGKGDRDRRLSKFLVDAYGEDWLRTISRQYGAGASGRITNYIDHVRAGLSVTTVVAALAALSTDSNELLIKLVQAGTAAQTRQTATPSRLDDEQLRKAYIRQRGIHHGVAKELDHYPATVKHRLDRAGLPTLTGQPLYELGRELTAFIDGGKSISQACGGNPEREAQLVQLLRGTARNLAGAVKQMNAIERASRRRFEAPPSGEPR
jgi:hypothetical protein